MTYIENIKVLEKKYNFKRLYETDTTNGDIEEMILLNLVVNKKVNSNELEDTFFSPIIHNYLNQTNQRLTKGDVCLIH